MHYKIGFYICSQQSIQKFIKIYSQFWLVLYLQILYLQPLKNSTHICKKVSFNSEKILVYKQKTNQNVKDIILIVKCPVFV